MAYTDYTPQQASETAHAMYERDIRSKVETGNISKYIVINIENGEYEVGDSAMELSDRLHTRQPNAALFGMRIGYRAAATIGRGWDALGLS